MATKKLIPFALTIAMVLRAVPSYSKDGKDFLFEPDMMHPQQYQSRIVAPGYYLRCQNDTLLCHLPYMGVAYTAPLDSSGLLFAAPLHQKNVKEGKKGKRILTFEASKNAVESFSFQLTIFKNGKADLRLRPTNAQSISYSGNIEIF